MPDIIGVHHVSLSVNDLDRSVRFYESVLGFTVVGEAEQETFRRKRLRGPGGHIGIAVTAHHGAPGEPFDERRAGIDHLAFDVGGVDDVHDLKRRFEEMAVVHSEIKVADNGVVSITLRDPDNIQLEVFGSPAG